MAGLIYLKPKSAPSASGWLTWLPAYPIGCDRIRDPDARLLTDSQPNMVANYLEQTFTWLSQVQDESIGYPADGYHLVQKWAWFSISDPTYSSSDLGDLSSGN